MAIALAACGAVEHHSLAPRDPLFRRHRQETAPTVAVTPR